MPDVSAVGSAVVSVRVESATASVAASSTAAVTSTAAEVSGALVSDVAAEASVSSPTKRSLESSDPTAS